MCVYIYVCVFTRTDMLEPLLVVCDTLFSQSLSLIFVEVSVKLIAGAVHLVYVQICKYVNNR